MVLLAGFGCRDSSPAEHPRLPPTRGYILISIDTLGADHLGCYGYPKPTSPFLDELASRSVLFENNVAQFTNTLTSHMSIFTSLYPEEHDVYPRYGVLSEEIETLPETFQKSGFRTAGFTGGGYTGVQLSRIASMGAEHTQMQVSAAP